MFGRVTVGVLTVALLIGGWALLRRRNAGRPGELDAVQWPFDGAELRSLMDRVISNQREHISSMQDIAGRDRAKAFLEYYERRRQSLAS